MRLQKYLANCGVASRRKSETYITDGRVTVNGQVVTELGTKIDLDNDVVTVDGKEINLEKQKVYYKFYKPSGCMCTVNDPQGRGTVLDYFKNVNERIYPVGRLDFESEGLLLLTNDGDFAMEVIHPRHHVAKLYTVLVSVRLNEKQLNQLCAGVILDGKITAPAEITYKGSTASGKFQYQFKLFEGKNRQIRRMCASVGARVVFIKRINIGNLELGSLKPGRYEKISEQEAREALKS